MALSLSRLCRSSLDLPGVRLALLGLLPLALVACPPAEDEEATPTATPTPEVMTPSPVPPSPTPELPSPTPEPPTPTLEPTPAIWEGPHAAVPLSDYAQGSLSLVDASSLEVAADLMPLGGDTDVKVAEGRAYLLVRSWGAAHSVVQLDPAKGYAEVGSLTLPVDANPYDLVVVSVGAGRRLGFVSLHGLGQLATFDPNTMQAGETLDLSAYAGPDEDGNPNPAALFLHGSSLFVALQRYDYTTFSPASPGMVLEIDISSLDVVRQYTLAGSNVMSLFVDTDGSLVVGSLGAYGEEDGGIERIPPSSSAEVTSPGFILTEATLGVTDLSGFVVAHGVGYLLEASVPRSFDLTTGALFSPDILSESVAASKLWADPRGTLWLSDAASGILYTFDPVEGELNQTGALSAKALFPYGLGFVGL